MHLEVKLGVGRIVNMFGCMVHIQSLFQKKVNFNLADEALPTFRVGTFSTRHSLIEGSRKFFSISIEATSPAVIRWSIKMAFVVLSGRNIRTTSCYEK